MAMRMRYRLKGAIEGVMRGILPAICLMMLTQTVAAAPVSTGASSAPADNAHLRPNIIFICVDDLSAGMTGFEGHPLVKTPHLDALAARSIRFTQAYCVIPAPAAARATILTSQYPHTHGITGDTGEPAPDTETVLTCLKRAGYTCGRVGGSHTPPPQPPPAANAAQPAPAPVTLANLDYAAVEEAAWTWEHCKIHVNGEAGTADKFLTDWHADRAIDFIDHTKGGPFFLWLQLRTWNDQPVFPADMTGQYPPGTITLPPDKNFDPKSRQGRFATCDQVQAYNRRKATLREAISRYDAAITRMDEAVGRLLDHLAAQHLADRTIVIFISAYGRAMGERGLFGTGPLLYEEFIRVPLLVHVPTSMPDLLPMTTTIDRLVSLIDLGPTVLQMTAAPKLIGARGRSLFPLMRDPQADHPDECFLEYEGTGSVKWPTRCLVTDDYKLIDYQSPSDRDAFYNLQRDPGETYNLADERVYAAVVRVMRSRLDHWRKETHDVPDR